MTWIGSLAVAAVLALAPQQATFRSRVEAVRVDVLVTADGRPLSGLTASDFDVRDNGVQQQVDLVSFEAVPVNVILAFDLSDSVTPDRMAHLRAASDALLGGLKPRDRTALITFSHIVSERSGLTADVQQIRKALDVAAPGGGTSLIDGVYAAMIASQSDAGRSLLLVFSDGVDADSWLSEDAALASAKQSDVVVYGVSVSPQKPEFLVRMASVTGGRVYENTPIADLKPILLDILEEFRHRYLLTYSPTGVATTGWHRVDVRVKGQRATVKARPGYMRTR